MYGCLKNFLCHKHVLCILQNHDACYEDIQVQHSRRPPTYQCKLRKVFKIITWKNIFRHVYENLPHFVCNNISLLQWQFTQCHALSLKHLYYEILWSFCAFESTWFENGPENFHLFCFLKLSHRPFLASNDFNDAGPQTINEKVMWLP